MFFIPPALVHDSMPIKEINYLPHESFVQFFKDIVIRSPDIPRRVAEKIPFVSDALKEAFIDNINNLNIHDKILILNKYADKMKHYILSLESTHLSDNNLEPGEVIALNEEDFNYILLRNLLLQYEEKFKFSFVFYTKDQTVDTLLLDLHKRLLNSKSQEVEAGIKAIIKTALDKLNERVRC